MRRFLCAVTLAIFGLAAPAFADPPEGELQAAPGSIAIGMIESASAEGVFDLVHDGQVTVRHVRSGLVCHFLRDGAGGRLVVFPQAARGEDVACDSSDGRESVTLYATRFSFPTTLDEQVVGADAAVRRRFPDARALPAPPDAVGAQMPARRLIQFLVARASDGAPMYTSASVAIIGEWVIKLRYTVLAPGESAVREGQLMSQAIFAEALGEMADHPPPP
jgi:hypothetical protein